MGLFSFLDLHGLTIYMAAALLPAVILMIYIYNKDKTEKEPSYMIRKMILGGIFAGERYYGRLRSIIASPSGKLPLILANGLYPALFAICASVCGFIVGSCVFGVDFSGVNLGLAALAILCAMGSAACFGLFLSVFGLISDSMHLVLNVVSYLLMIFTGAEFPVSQLPLIGRIISQLMPLTKSISAMNLLFQPDHSRFAVLLLGELATGAAYALLARAVFGFAERTAQRTGRFDMF